jgi:polyisoprenoid-binding protein YceI
MNTVTMERPATTHTQVATWRLDPSHTSVGFAVQHLMIARVRGRFADVSGEIVIDDGDLRRSRVSVEIDAASIDTRDARRDEHLRSADFLHTTEFPSIRFESTSIRGSDEDGWQMEGALTIRGVTRPVVLAVEPHGALVDPWGNERRGFSATTKIDRRDFGLTWNQGLEAGGVLVGNEVRISIDVEAVRAAAPA